MIEPFKGFRIYPNGPRSGELLCLPYDCLTPDIEKKLRAVNLNAIHLEEPRPNLSMGRRRWQKWVWEKRLIDDKASYYLLTETFGGVKRAGILALARLTGNAPKKYIWPHENVYRKFIGRRKNHFRKLKLHLSPIFLVAEDRNKLLRYTLDELLAASSRWPKSNFPPSLFDKVARDLVLIQDKFWIDRLKEALEPREGFLVADGHHRYQAALELAKTGRLTHTLCYVTSSQGKVGLLKQHPAIPGRRHHEQKVPSLPDVIALAKQGKLMPRKTTYFWPKIPCGLVYAEI
ncbi:MAG: DUF1015 family protein [Elusimicrobia bacterium]|nr:DUF1015 family protein [Elusimicrobiota bacterium]